MTYPKIPFDLDPVMAYEVLDPIQEPCWILIPKTPDSFKPIVFEPKGTYMSSEQDTRLDFIQPLLDQNLSVLDACLLYHHCKGDMTMALLLIQLCALYNNVFRDGQPEATVHINTYVSKPGLLRETLKYLEGFHVLTE